MPRMSSGRRSLGKRVAWLGAKNPTSNALYQRLGFKAGDFPHAEYTGRNILTLPLFPAMQDADVERVVDTLHRILRAHARLPRAATSPQNATDAR